MIRILWLCSLIGLWCGPVPTVAAIQTAYEREAASGSKLHDAGLKLLSAKCHNNVGEQVLCEVTFISTGDPSERLYFDIIAVAETSDGWQLTSGLCKR